jgi:diguanylate cyclase (GGDEF)-like protein
MRAFARGAAYTAVAGFLVHGAWIVATGEKPVEFVNTGVYCAVIAAAAIACLARAAAVREDRLAWALIGLGTASWAVAEVYWAAVVAGQRPEPYPSPADFLYLLDYAFAIIGIALLARAHVRRVGLGTLLDGAIAAIGVAAIAAAVLEPVLSALRSHPDELRVAIDTAYPAFDIAILACIAGAAAALGWRRDWALLALGFGSMAIADVVYLRQDATTGYIEGTLLDSAWLLGAAATALAAAWSLRPDIRQARYAHASIAPTVAAAFAIAILVYDHYEQLAGSAIVLAAITLLLALVRLGVAFAENATLLAGAQEDAVTDSLTGLHNRRKLLLDLRAALDAPNATERPTVFSIFDLDGFKGYNDTFGHPAGDLLLRRLGAALAASVPSQGRAYRLGGDEFCLLAPLDGARAESIVAAGAAALHEDGEGFDIGCSRGHVVIPYEATEPSDAMRLADRRLYADKGRSGRSFELQARDLLLGVLREREPGLHAHMQGVGELAVALGRAIGLDGEDLDVLGRAADLHDIGKMAIPDQILNKPGPLSSAEWDLMRTHTLVAERMLNVAPALTPVGRLIRSSHERWDGEGYPDRLAGDEIPIGSRIIAICDAFEAMIEERPYRDPVGPDEALAELRRNAGTQFDPELVELFAEQLAADPALAEAP